MFAPNPFKMSCDTTCNEDNTEFNPVDEDELRAEVFSRTKDYTISELAGMGKDTLVEILGSLDD